MAPTGRQRRRGDRGRSRCKARGDQSELRRCHHSIWYGIFASPEGLPPTSKLSFCPFVFLSCPVESVARPLNPSVTEGPKRGSAPTLPPPFPPPRPAAFHHERPHQLSRQPAGSSTPFSFWYDSKFKFMGTVKLCDSVYNTSKNLANLELCPRSAHRSQQRLAGGPEVRRN